MKRKPDTHFWDINAYTKRGYFYVREYEPWMKPGQQYGDLGHDTLRKIKEEKDKSPWARASFAECERLLVQGKRWPDEMEKEISKHWMRTFPIIKLMYLSKAKWVRSQYSITRDPWVAYYSCGIELGYNMEHSPMPPWWICRPNFIGWIRALKGKRSWYKPPKKYVRDLREMRESSYDKIYS